MTALRRPPRACAALLGALALLLASAAPAAAPARVALSYDVYRNGTHVATISETFERRDATYRIRSESRAVGLLALIARGQILVTSEGTVTDRGLRPRRFEHTRGGSQPTVAEFDWAANRLVMRHGTTTDSKTLEPNLQDRLSAMYQFMFLPLAGTAELHLPVTNGSKIEHYRYDVRHGETMETPVARHAVVHLIKQRAPGDNATEIWLASTQHQLPVRMLIVESNGDRLEQVLGRMEVSD